jgi:hypothetical protein
MGKNVLCAVIQKTKRSFPLYGSGEKSIRRNRRPVRCSLRTSSVRKSARIAGEASVWDTPLFQSRKLARKLGQHRSPKLPDREEGAEGFTPKATRIARSRGTAPVGGPPSAVEFLLTLMHAVLARLILVPANLAQQRPLPTFLSPAPGGRHRGSYPFPSRKRESTVLCSRSTPLGASHLKIFHSLLCPA